MTTLDRFTIAAGSLLDFVPLFYILIAVTLAVSIILALCCRGVWLDSPQIKLVSLFFEMDARGALCLASSWTKFLIFIMFVVKFQVYDMSYYIFVVMIALPYCLLCGGTLRILGRMFWVLLQLLGLLSTNILCGYILEIQASNAYYFLYVLLAGFFIVFALYLFLVELNEISTERRVNLEALERKANHEG